MKQCSKCSETKLYNEFHNKAESADGKDSMCKSCKNALKREHSKALRLSALESLGGKCCECGNDDRRVLDIDHIDGKGHEERNNRLGVLRKIIKGDIDNYQCLCANCHRIKTWEQLGHKF